jgi:hypothetical protein
VADNQIFCGANLTAPLTTETPDGVNKVTGAANVRNSLYDGPNPVPNLPGDYDYERPDPYRA